MQAKLHPMMQTDRELRRSIKRLLAFADAHPNSGYNHKAELLAAELGEARKIIPNELRDVSAE